MIDPVRLQHIVLVAREGNFGRAALAANLSQPALSRSIQATERRFGVKIFDRGRNGVFLTQAGQQFLVLAEDFVRRAESLEAELRVVSTGGAGSVSFGIGPLAATLLLAELTDLCFEQGIRVMARVDQDTALRRLLVDGEIEFYIGGSWSGTNDFAMSSRLSVEHIGIARYCLVVREGHPLVGPDPVTPERVAAFPVIGGTLIRRILNDEMLAATGLRSPSLQVDNYSILIDIARRSDAILLGSPFLTECSWGRGLVPIDAGLPEDQVNVAASLVWLEGRTMPHAADLLARRLVCLLRQVTG